jgi:nucleotide-binding universal stress UspA family protein
MVPAHGGSAVAHGWRRRPRHAIVQAFARKERVSDCLICGVDDSAGAREAARVADVLAARLAARLVLVHAARVPVVPGASRVPDAHQELLDCTHADARRVLARVATDAGCLDAERRVEVGDPVERLVGVAQETDALMLVIGSSARGRISAFLHGDVERPLCRRARRPVLVVPAGGASALVDRRSARRKRSLVRVRTA